MPRLLRILKWTGLTLAVVIAGLFAVGWVYDNTPLGCYIEEEYPPLKPGTPEYAAMQVAARQGPQGMVNPSGLGSRIYLYADEYPIDDGDRSYFVKSDAKDFWFITFQPKHEKSIFGCDDGFRQDGSWTAIVRKRDLKVMNRKDQMFN